MYSQNTIGSWVLAETRVTTQMLPIGKMIMTEAKAQTHLREGEGAWPEPWSTSTSEN